MKRLLITLTTLTFSGTIFAQMENPRAEQFAEFERVCTDHNGTFDADLTL